jgi:NitT/TauT family transport system ATP-binding protein
MLKIDRVSKSFNVRATGKKAFAAPSRMTVLDDINFEVGNGEFVSLLGASGCGKTTLLRIIAGLIRPDLGAVSLADNRIDTPRKDVCMVFQNFGLLPWRTVMDNVAFPLEIDGNPRAEREEVAAHYIGIVGLKGFESHYPHELSGGMQQRVGMARALTRKPVVLLMDEPFGALDAQTREALQDDFIQIWKDLNTTIVFVTHAIDEAILLSDRIVVLSSRPGRVEFVVSSVVARDRLARDIRARPDFAAQVQEIRNLLRQQNNAA